MFSEELAKIDWEGTTARIASKTSRDVEIALSKSRLLDVDDFMALISPAATPYLEQMARLSQRYTQERFGKTISLYIPLYLSNECTNYCVYCGFNFKNDIKRVTLNDDEIRQECEAIKRLGDFDNILLLTGEFPAVAGVAYIENALRICRPYFNNLSMEVMPLKEKDYYRLTQAGLNGVTCFQETYHKADYNIYHPHGMKSIFDWRVNAYDRMGAAGLHKIGMGILIGLDREWRTDITMLAYHLRYLQKHYWRSRFSVNFPRLRPAAGGYQPNVVMSSRELAQLTFAFRIFDHDIDISYSTREEPGFRENMMKLGVTSMSAGSKTDPGGYSRAIATEQFHVSDERTPQQVVDDIRAQGYEAVWKDWDKIFD